MECRDAADAGGWGALAEEHAFVLAMEVLDNMPHDRVAHDARSGAWLQTRVARGAPCCSCPSSNPNTETLNMHPGPAECL